MQQMIISTVNGYTEQFCTECGEKHPSLSSHLAANLDHIKVTENVCGEICDGCGRLIRDVPVYQRIYLLKPELHLAFSAEIPAQSVVEARKLLHEALRPKQLLRSVEQSIEQNLEGDLLSGQETFVYHVADPQVFPPPRNERVTDLPERSLPVASPPATLSDLFDLAPVYDLLDRFEKTGLAERYAGSFETCLILHRLFAQARMEHRLMQGYLSRMSGSTHPHVWLDLSPVLGPGWLVDYRACHVFGLDAPLGLFASKDYPAFSYYGVQSPLPLRPPRRLLQDIEEAFKEETVL